ncbi:MAG TPA: hypothetical protein DDX84_01560 [Nitrospiraceae bacterium]|nr:hypothetical protein [Nitrospiraceae bacterium]
MGLVSGKILKQKGGRKMSNQINHRKEKVSSKQLMSIVLFINFQNYPCGELTNVNGSVNFGGMKRALMQIIT